MYVSYKASATGTIRFIEAIVAGLIATDEQDRRSPRIEGAKHPKRPAAAFAREARAHARAWIH
jgi:hypothetical protein